MMLSTVAYAYKNTAVRLEWLCLVLQSVRASECTACYAAFSIEPYVLVRVACY